MGKLCISAIEALQVPRAAATLSEALHSAWSIKLIGGRDLRPFRGKV